MPAYTLDKTLEDLATDIIKTDRPYLGVVKITYMFRPEAAMSDGKVTAGMCIRVDDRNWAVHKHDFIIEIAYDVWTEATPEFRRALMDHELGHVGIRFEEDGHAKEDEKTGRIRTYCKHHDIEEFEDVLERHGPYHKSLRSFLIAFAKHKINKKKEAEAAQKRDQETEKELLPEAGDE